MSRLRGLKIVTSSETLDPVGNEFFFIDASNNDITFTIKKISLDGEKYTIKRIDTTTNIVTIIGSDFEKIGCQNSVILNSGDSLVLLSYNNNWCIIPNENSSNTKVAINIISDVKGNNTPGGTFTSGSYQVRTLNTLSGNGPVTLSANQFTLPAGTYIINSSAPCFGVGNNQTRLFNITTSTVDAIGTSETSRIGLVSGNLIGSTVKSKISYYVILTNPTTYQIEHQCSITQENIGYGEPANMGNNEIYTIVTVKKIA